MKKFIKMLSYSKEGRKEYNTPFALTFAEHYTKKKKKKRCYLNSIFNILFFFFINERIFDRIRLVLKRKNCYNLKQFKSIDGIKGVF